jgi:hypothetical protein
MTWAILSSSITETTCEMESDDRKDLDSSGYARLRRLHALGNVIAPK